MKRVVLISLLLLGGCAVPQKKTAVTTQLSSSTSVVFTPNAWVRGVTQEDIAYVKSALGQVRGEYQVNHPIISLGKSSALGLESMRAYTVLYYYDFERAAGCSWALVRFGPYNAD